MKFNVRFVHKISPKSTDTMGPIDIPPEALLDRKALAASLRKHKVLTHGGRIDNFRIEGGKVVAFPQASIWHSIILTSV